LKIRANLKSTQKCTKNLVRRAGFEPANPYGRGWLIGAGSDLESSAFDLAPRPPPNVSKAIQLI
jgi:hypothetical protein